MVEHVGIDHDREATFEPQVAPLPIRVDDLGAERRRRFEAARVVVDVDDLLRVERNRRHHRIQPDRRSEATHDEHGCTGSFGQRAGDAAVTVGHVVGDARCCDGIDAFGQCEQHDIGPRDSHQFGERTTEVDTAVGPKPECRARRHVVTRIGVAASAWGTRQAAELEGHDDAIPGLPAASPVAHGDDLTHHLVTHHERRRHRIQTHRDGRVEITARHRKRANDRIAFVDDLGPGYGLPGQIHRPTEHQGLHVHHCAIVVEVTGTNLVS